VNLITEIESTSRRGFDSKYSSSASSRSPTDSSSSSSDESDSDDEPLPQTSEAWCTVYCTVILYSERLFYIFFFEFHYRAPRDTEPHIALVLSVQCTLMCGRCLLVNRVILAAFKLPWHGGHCCVIRVVGVVTSVKCGAVNYLR
jgi:hypothetical protein